jgi:hypothetical protein
MITYETVQKIGHLIGMPYTTFNGRSDIPEDSGTVMISGECNYYKSEGGRPPLLIFTDFIVSGRHTGNTTNSVYVLNLITLKPTKNSYKQIQLPTSLKTLIRNEM